MAHSPYDCIVSELHRDSFEVMRGRRDGQAHPVVDGLLPQAAGGKASIIKYKEDVPTEPDKDHVSFLMELEGGRPFQEDYSSGRKMHEKLATLRAFYRMGVRGAQLTHNGRNELADGMIDWRTGGGLSEFGVAVVKEMNRLHMLIGISHLTDTCFYEVLEVSSDPVIASHCNASMGRSWGT